ncbi:hypothetical protein BN59_00872 [Legionella massiliensis]|uniref:SidC homolog n=1 Tax=Legionella massiliensis TaxID=1034943 RepID=A0A078KXY7_9GAMM|nr:hypothetical protein [Legionella massiliensis]CDZ76598.1 hypothetical protein BN59_00872 [Legionella massiliensis]CEE12336.1 hypothetical protein BN1094_00872 [Legionella massiliensis]
MHLKTELFSSLAPDTRQEIKKKISITDLVNLASTSTQNWSLFQPMLEVDRFLQAVVNSDHETVKKLLEKNSNLLIKRGSVTDGTGRTFADISGFEYALWALDKHLWTKMLDCLAQNEGSKAIFSELDRQYKQVQEKGVHYQLNGEEFIEKHFDFENTIIDALDTQINRSNARLVNWEELDLLWRTKVGGAQKLLPMHVVYEYCSDTPFEPRHKFSTQPNASKQFYNWISHENENWFSTLSKLGSDYAIYKGAQLAAVRSGVIRDAATWSNWVSIDLSAMESLYEARLDDLDILKSWLQEQLTANNLPVLATR